MNPELARVLIIEWGGAEVFVSRRILLWFLA